MIALTTSHIDIGYRNKTLDFHDGLFAYVRDWRTVQNMYINCYFLSNLLHYASSSILRIITGLSRYTLYIRIEKKVRVGYLKCFYMILKRDTHLIFNITSFYVWYLRMPKGPICTRAQKVYSRQMIKIRNSKYKIQESKLV